MSATFEEPVHASEAASLIWTWLRRWSQPESLAWLADQLRSARNRSSNRELYITLGLIGRRFPKTDLKLSAQELRSAQQARSGWDPRGWSMVDAVRVLVLADLSRRETDFPELYRELCRTADVSEAIAFYRGLPLYGHAAPLESQAAEGVRSNVRAVFEAVAHRNPYPREQFSEDRWNQMILKALFVGSSLAPIQGLDERSNSRLAAMLSDFAHERWAARRSVSLELWRCVGPFARERECVDLQRVIDTGHATERTAAVLALSASKHPAARAIVEAHAELANEIVSGRISWNSLGAEPKTDGASLQGAEQ